MRTKNIRIYFKGDIKMKRYILFLISLFSLAVSTEAGFIYFTQTRLFIIDLEQTVPNMKVAMLRPFIIIPNRLLNGSEQEGFLCCMFNYKEISLEMESKVLEWEPEYRKENAIFPRLVQAFTIEGKKFEITLIPVGNDVSLGFRIQVSKIKSLPDENENILPQLQAIYDATSEGIILNTEINKFGYVFFVCFPVGKKMYILSFSNISGIKSSIR